MYVLMLKISHRPDGKIAIALASTLACTTAGLTLRSTTVCTCRRYLQFPIAPMGDQHVACCLQGGGVLVTGGTVTISSSNISGNTAPNVRAHFHKGSHRPDGRLTFDSLVVCRVLVSMSSLAQ